MGNNKSKQRKHVHGSHKTRDEEESDIEEEEEILEIDEQAESGGFLSGHCDKCEHLYGSQLIPLKDFSLDALPDALRNEQVLDFILSQQKIAVKLIVEKSDRSGYSFASGWAGVSEETVVEYASCPLTTCSVNEGHKHKAYGGITIYTNKHVITNNVQAANTEVSFFYDGIDSNQNQKTFPLSDSETKFTTNVRAAASTKFAECEDVKVLAEANSQRRANGQCEAEKENLAVPSDKVHADTHENISVVNNQSDATHKTMLSGDRSESTLRDFEIPDQSCTAWGLFVKQDRINKDLVALDIVFHDPRLFDLVAATSGERLSSWANMPEALKKELKEHVLVFSHPHGRPKMISVGKLICLETVAVKKDIQGLVRETRYSAATCRGSSGAPVISGHYPYRPFTHSSKKKLEEGGFENFSQSY